MSDLTLKPGSLAGAILGLLIRGLRSPANQANAEFHAIMQRQIGELLAFSRKHHDEPLFAAEMLGSYRGALGDERMTLKQLAESINQEMQRIAKG